MTVQLGLLCLGALWATGASCVLVLIWNWVREQRRDQRVEQAVFAADCEKANLEALFKAPAFGEEQAA